VPSRDWATRVDQRTTRHIHKPWRVVANKPFPPNVAVAGVLARIVRRVVDWDYLAVSEVCAYVAFRDSKLKKERNRLLNAIVL
jgi:hypothetical protein